MGAHSQIDGHEKYDKISHVCFPAIVQKWDATYVVDELPQKFCRVEDKQTSLWIFGCCQNLYVSCALSMKFKSEKQFGMQIFTRVGTGEERGEMEVLESHEGEIWKDVRHETLSMSTSSSWGPPEV